MALIRWQPFQEIDTLQREMNRLFDDIVTPATRRDNGFAFVPAAEIQETDDAVQLKLEVPGMEAKDLNVEVTPEAVTVNGERKSEVKTEEKGVTRTEFRYGKFHRVIPLPVEVDNQKVQAEYKDGILMLSLPKLDNDRRKAVKVNLA
jgi:HSP20 family protein